MQIDTEIDRLESLRPKLSADVRARLADAAIEDTSGPCTVAQLLRRQNVTYEKLLNCLDLERLQDVDNIEEVEIQIKYSGYIKRQLQQIHRFKKLETRAIPFSFIYDDVLGFSKEVREKLKQVRPASIGQASRISGITPAAISLLLVALEKHKRKAGQDQSLQPST